jgi:hypothetical protein
MGFSTFIETLSKILFHSNLALYKNDFYIS